MKSLLQLHCSLLSDLYRGHRGLVGTALLPWLESHARKDVVTMTKRVEREGESFFTITLPNFARDFEQMLETGGRTSKDGLFIGWKTSKSSPLMPAFLHGLTGSMLNGDGSLKGNSDVLISSIRAVRQFCLFTKKVERACLPKRVDKAYQSYLDCEAEVSKGPADAGLFECFGKVADIVISSVCDNSMYGDLVPRHGSGAVVEHFSNNAKWANMSWTQRLEAVMPWMEFVPSSLHPTDMGAVALLDSLHEPPAKVIHVPKTMKTPRVIAIEPAHNQFVQQGIMRWLVPRIEHLGVTAGRINFRDQKINQNKAQEGSIVGNLATLDLSEASDRVSYVAAKRLFRVFPQLWDILEASRSNYAKLPNGEVILLKKFASMGSAVCFPVEALVFFCTMVASRIHSIGATVNASSVKKYADGVYVYGDDLICPVHEVPCVIRGLESMGLKVNHNKSFWNGQFRESCGGEFYAGKWVTPVYLRRDLPSDMHDSQRIVSTVMTARQLEKAGCYATAEVLYQSAESVIGKLSTVPDDSGALGRYGFSTHTPKRRWNKNLQRVEEKLPCVRVRRQADPIDGYPALAKCFRTIGLKTIDTDHLLKSVRPRDLTISRNWFPVN